eukprot:15434314-Alexandrium_andersonii.AAC.1
MLARNGAGVRSVGHPPAHAVHAPRPERHVSALMPLALFVGGGRRAPSDLWFAPLLDFFGARAG